MENKAKVLMFDLEVTPMLSWTYQMYDTNVLKVERHSYIMCFSYKWLGDSKVRCISQLDFPARYKLNPYDDRDVVRELWNLFDQADIIVAHNLNGFDKKVGTGRFFLLGMTPPQPYKTVDTLTIARSKFKLASNKLGDVCERLGIGTKSEETHSDLWYDCVNGNKKSWKKMIEYCKNDTYLLEKLYLRERPYISNHPNIGLIIQRPDVCPKCGCTKMRYIDNRCNKEGPYRRFRCNDCGGFMRERLMDKDRAEEIVRPTYVNE